MCQLCLASYRERTGDIWNDAICTDNAIDFIVLIAKFFIYKCRFQDSIPNCKNFFIDLKYRLEIEKEILPLKVTR